MTPIREVTDPFVLLTISGKITATAISSSVERLVTAVASLILKVGEKQIQVPILVVMMFPKLRHIYTLRWLNRPNKEIQSLRAPHLKLLAQDQVELGDVEFW
jgi:hypothetical protein